MKTSTSSKDKMKQEDRGIELVKQNILFLSDCENMEEAISFFEERRHLPSPYRTQEYFDELNISQIAVLFKVLIDSGDVIVEDNVIKQESKSK
jgi:hypothetical protein